MSHYSSRFPLIILIAGILFSLYLVSKIPNDVFFSGDGGLKALLAEQFSSGKFRFDLNLPVENWVKTLWEQGFYPFKPPFVYDISNRYYITFPFTFPLITAPFYSLFGFRGLYIIPLVSTWLIWLSFYGLCQRLKLGNTITALALITLIFASPLTLYSAMYWEHTLAVALAFHGIATVLVPPQQGLSNRTAIISGMLFGLAVWFRPEFLCLVGIFFLIFFVTKLEQFKKLRLVTQKTELFHGSLLLTVGAFFGINTLVYHHPMGIHAVQVLEHFTIQERLSVAWKNLKDSSFALIYYFPTIAFSLIGLLLSLFNSKVKLSPKMKMLVLVCILFLLSVPLIVPPGAGGKQWASRFLLILIPLISLLAITQLELIFQLTNQKLRSSFLLLFLVFLAIGTSANTYSGTAFLEKNYQAIPPAIAALRKQPDKIILISHQFVAQALPTLFDEKVFFLAEDRQNVTKLSSSLLDKGVKKFIYVCYPYRACDVPKQPLETTGSSPENRPFKLEFSKLGKFGIYPSYQGLIIENNPQSRRA
ncbi:MAG TPA: dolichol-phosphate mannosyltransferase [Cyanophyceae cyanobacterium]